MSTTSTILLRRGTQSDIIPYVEQAGELVWGTDSNQLTVGGRPVSYWRNETNQLELYASPVGVSTNTGLSVASPLPLTDAIDFANKQPASYVWEGIRINLATGSYYITSSLIFNGRSSMRIASYSAPRTCKIYATGSAVGYPIISVSDNATLTITGIQLIPGNTVSSSLNQYTGVLSDKKGWVYIDNVIFGDTNKWMRYCVFATMQSIAVLSNTASIDTNVWYNIFDSVAGSSVRSNASQFQFRNNPYASNFIHCGQNSVFANGVVPTFSGSNSVARKGTVDQFSTVNLGGLPVASVPGILGFATGSLTVASMN